VDENSEWWMSVGNGFKPFPTVSWFDKLTMKTTVQSDEWKVMSRKRETSFSFHSPLVAHCFSLIVFAHCLSPIAHRPSPVFSLFVRRG
jgi:hypothetical protein